VLLGRVSWENLPGKFLLGERGSWEKDPRRKWFLGEKIPRRKGSWRKMFLGERS
jgi:hypothetical protein